MHVCSMPLYMGHVFFFCDLGSSKAYAACVLRRDDYVKIGDLISRYRDVL